MKLITRKAFLKSIIGITGSFFAYMFYKSLKINDHIVASNRVQTLIKNDFPEGFTFVNEIIIVTNNQKIKIFSDKCTHLGCNINKSSGTELVCSCHGSRFSAEGEVVSGPAVKYLESIPFRIDNSRNVIILNHEA